MINRWIEKSFDNLNGYQMVVFTTTNYHSYINCDDSSTSEKPEAFIIDFKGKKPRIKKADYYALRNHYKELRDRSTRIKFWRSLRWLSPKRLAEKFAERILSA